MQTDEQHTQPITGRGNIDQLIRLLVSGPVAPGSLFLAEGVTFGEIYQWADQICYRFSEQKSPPTPLCICTLNRAHVAAAFIAALSGGPPFILPFGHTVSLLAAIKQKVGYQFALTEEPLDLPAGVEPIILDINQERTVFNEPQTDAVPSEPCLYLFTGGSTGTPQVWPKTARNLLAEASYLASTFHITPKDRILASVPPNHIYGFLYSVLLPLITGACTSEKTPFYPKEIDAALADTRATVLVSTPPHYRTLRETPVSRHHIHTAFSSAGALAEEDDWAFEDATGVAITEVYGSTETGGIAFRKRAEGQLSLTTFSCVETKIKEEALWVRSAFLSDTLPTDEDGFFQTADRAELEGTKGFRLLGRSDGIVKVGGKRVDLLEVQQSIKKTPGVLDAHVFAKSIETGRENEIFALVEGEVTMEQVRKTALKNLPPYAHPRHLKIVDKIPVSASGKYNRTAIEQLFKQT